jgi:hypothetical protein
LILLTGSRFLDIVTPWVGNLQGYDTGGRKSIEHLLRCSLSSGNDYRSRGADRHSDNPTSIPTIAYFWSDNPGISGRFPSESVVGFFRNHWSDNVGILTRTWDVGL